MFCGRVIAIIIGGTVTSIQVEIRVTEGITRGQGISSYIGYIIKVKKPTNISIERRYSEFASLR